MENKFQAKLADSIDIKHRYNPILETSETLNVSEEITSVNGKFKMLQLYRRREGLKKKTHTHTCDRT